MGKSLWHVLFGLRERSRDPLDGVLFIWPTGDTFTIRDMLRSVEVKGVTGSGKSSGSLKFFMEALLKHPRSTCFIIAQKPEDREFFKRLFKRFKKPLAIIEEKNKWRCNFLDTEMRAGSDTRGLVEFLITLGEALDGGQGGGQMNEKFWRKLEERIIWNAIVCVLLATGKVDAPSLLRFLTTAPFKPQDFASDDWKKKYHYLTMMAADAKKKTAIEKADFEVASQFWAIEFPQMDDKPRSSGLAGVMNTLHTFNTGLVREMCSTSTNITPAVMDEGVSVLVNFPFANYGPTGRFIAGGLKYLWQKHVLRRHWNPNGYFNIMVLDEYQESATEFDARYLAQCRSHGASLFCLTQTIHSEYATMGGHGHHHRADQLLSNFGLHIYHVVDAETAKFASALLGQRRESFTNVTPKQDTTWGEEIFGQAQSSFSMSESYQPILQPAEFMNGRTGGPQNGYLVDGIVIKIGEKFSNRENWMKIAFSQK